MSGSANYFIKSGSEFSIYYDHLRALQVVADLYTGEKNFIDLVRNCNESEFILGQEWLEAAVLVDFDEHTLYFWSCYFSIHSSIMDMYVLELAKKWSGWKIVHSIKHMEDMQVVLGIDHISLQELPVPEEVDKDSIIMDKIDEWDTTLVIIRVDGRILSTTVGDLSFEDLLAYGKDVVDILLKNANEHLPAEQDFGGYELMLIDMDKRAVIIGPYSFGDQQLYGDKWKGYNISSGDHGYPGILSVVGIDGKHLLMPPELAKRNFEEMIKSDESSDIAEPVQQITEEQIIEESNDIESHLDFFDSSSPGKTFVERLKANLKKWFR